MELFANLQIVMITMSLIYQRLSLILNLSVSFQIAQPTAVHINGDGLTGEVTRLLGEDVETYLNRDKREIISGVSDGAVHIIPEEDVKELCLNAHNYVRSLHPGVPPLTWSSDLARGAEDWAAYLAGEGSIRHATLPEKKEGCGGVDCGENIYSMARAATGEVPDSANGVYAWYNEWKCWDFESGVKLTTGKCGTNPVTGHLTQALWLDTTEVGCGIATVSQDYTNKKGILKKNKFQYTVVVARYLPPGNYKSKFKSEVPEPGENAIPPVSADELRVMANNMSK